jgi:hypothetical protein
MHFMGGRDHDRTACLGRFVLDEIRLVWHRSQYALERSAKEKTPEGAFLF